MLVLCRPALSSPLLSSPHLANELANDVLFGSRDESLNGSTAGPLLLWKLRVWVCPPRVARAAVRVAVIVWFGEAAFIEDPFGEEPFGEDPGLTLPTPNRSALCATASIFA